MDIHIDFETYSEVDLAEVGGQAYARHPSTEVTLMAYRSEDYDGLLDFTDTGYISNRLRKEILDPDNRILAFNAEFEWLIFNYVLDIPLPYEHMVCVMAAAWRLGFTRGMKEVQRQIGVSEEDMKRSDGRKLVMKFCKPAPANHKVKRYDRMNSFEEWQHFKEYCRQDVIAMMSIWNFIKKYQ